MELLRIEGSRADLVRLRDRPELQVIASSAVDRGDGSWLVSAYAPDGGARALRDDGLTVRSLKGAEQVRDEWAVAAPTKEAASGVRRAGPAGYLGATAIGERIERLASAHPGVCTAGTLPDRTHEGRTVPYLRIGTGAEMTVLVIGGVHAREWAPPDALLSLAENLVEAYAAHRDLEHPQWVDESARAPITYAAWSTPAAEIERLVEERTLLIVPLVNPDGRDFSIAEVDGGAGEVELHRMWRKNRRPPPAGHSAPRCHGVDLNRNFDIAWDFDTYYSPAAAREVQSSKDPCDQQIFIGPSAASEPETRNVQWLVVEQRPSLFMDVHAYGRAILFPWGMDDDQGTDTVQSFRNRDWDRGGPRGGRDGVGGTYGEYLPPDLAAGHQAVARRMRDAIRDQAGPDPRARERSLYTAKQALGLYPTTGTSDDYCTALTMLDGSRPPITAFCLECGTDQAPRDPGDNEGGFHPDRAAKFPKIEREIHAAVLALAAVGLSSPAPPP